LSSIVTDFLLFAKPQTGNPVSIRLDKAVDEIVALFKLDAVCAGRIEITVKIDQPVFVKMDPGHFKQIFWNLLKNAAEAIEKAGKIRIKVNFTRGNFVNLKIMDNGCGIKIDDKGSVFDPFFTTKANGTGLGLSIIHRLIDSYQGMIDLESQPGKGTVFTVILKNADPQQNLDT